MKASGTNGVKKKYGRISGLQKLIFEAMRTRVPRRSRTWFRYRRALLRGALREDGYKITDFAQRMNITHTHLNFVLRGGRPSARIDAAAAMLITYVYGERLGSRYQLREPRGVVRWKPDTAALKRMLLRDGKGKPI